MRMVVVCVLLGGCATVDVKGRETLRVGPLRNKAVAPALVQEQPVDVDAGTDVLTDEELAKVAADLPSALRAAFDRLAQERSAVRVGEARVFLCRLRAGLGRLHTVYEAQCRVRLVVEGTPVIEVHAESVRRTRARAISQQEAERIKTLERNPLLDVADSRAVLIAALEAAARLIVDGALPPREGDPVPLSRAERAALAREKLAKGGNARVALFELGESGGPPDAALVLPFLEYADVDVRAAAIAALGELCDPATSAYVEAFVGDENAAIQRATRKAAAQLTACAQLRLSE